MEKMVAQQFQLILNEMDYLDSFQSGFRSGLVTEMTLVAFLDDLR